MLTKKIPQHVINALRTDVELKGMNFHQVALFLYHFKWTQTIISNRDVIRLLYGSISNYLDKRN